MKTTSKVTREATSDEKGVTTYTAIFAIKAFTAQTADVENIEALGHDWDEGKVTKAPTETEQDEKTSPPFNPISAQYIKQKLTNLSYIIHEGFGFANKKRFWRIF